VLLTGSELVRGDVRDENGAFLARELTRLGLEPERIVIAGDRPEELLRALQEALEADLAVVSGGLGPTHDDRTVELLAQAAELPLEIDRALRAEIEAVSRGYAERLGRPYADFETGVLKQAALPDGAVALGLAGTAPAVLLEHDGRVAVALPGPPGELRGLWPRVLEHPAVDRIARRAGRRLRRSLRFFGPSESAIARALAEADVGGTALDVTVCARDLEIEVDLLGGDGAHVESVLRDRFGDELFAVDDERPVAALVLDAARAQSLKVGTAESSTGGMIGARLTDVAGSSEVFVGAVVAYSNELKARLLGVPEKLLEERGAVSPEVASAMAAGARTRLGADVAVSVTGIAGPEGGTREKPVGLHYLHARSPHGELAWGGQLSGDREAVRSRATAIALHLLRRLLAQDGDRHA
jgi:nicotinamide-nucleotide amidase